MSASQRILSFSGTRDEFVSWLHRDCIPGECVHFVESKDGPACPVNPAPKAVSCRRCIGWCSCPPQVEEAELDDCPHGFIRASCSACRAVTGLRFDHCQTYLADQVSLAQLAEALRSVHPSDLTTPSVLDHVQVMGQLARVLYVRQRVAVMDGTFMVSCGEIHCCGGDATAEHMAFVERALAELSLAG